MLRPFYLALLEVKRFLVDRGDVATSIALPIALFSLMLGVFGGGASFNGTAHVANLDEGAVSGELIERLNRVDGVSVELYTGAELNDALDRSAVLSGFVIPAGFSANMEAGAPSVITVRRRGSGGDEGQIIGSILQGIAQDLAAEYELRNAIAALVSDTVTSDGITATAQALAAEARETPPVSVVTESLAEDEADILDRLLPGVVVMFLLFSVTIGAQTLIEDRRIGTLERLVTTRLSLEQMFIGKFLAGLSRGMLQVMVLMGLAFLVFRVAGPLVFLQSMVLAIVVAASVSALGLTIATLARSQEQATWSAVFFTMFMTIFGGTFFPVPDAGVLGILSRFTLNKYAINAFEGILNGTSTLADQWFEIALLGGVTLVGLVIARTQFRISAAVK